MIAGKKDLVSALAVLMHITKKEAEKNFDVVISVLKDAIAEGGVRIPDLMTIKLHERKGRKGKIGLVSGEVREYESSDKVVLTIKAAKSFDEKLNR